MNHGKQSQTTPLIDMEGHGGLPFLLKCNYDSKLLEKQPPLRYSEMLEYFKELGTGHPDVYRSEFILWNNKQITIENSGHIFLRKESVLLKTY